MAERKVAVVGIGQTIHKVHAKKGWRMLLNEAVQEALDDAHMTIDDIDTGYLSMGAPEFHGQNHPACVANWDLGMYGTKGFIHVENACASGTSALKIAWMTILSGMADVVLVAGVEKPNDNAISFDVSGYLSDVEWEYKFGLSWALGGVAKINYMKKYGATDEEMLAATVVEHEYAVKNPKCSQYGMTPMTIEQAKMTPTFWGTTHIAEMCLTTDGACAIILASSDRAKDFTSKPVFVERIENGAEPELLANKWMLGCDEFLAGPGMLDTIKNLYDKTGLGPKDIDIAMVHDSVTVAAPILLEDLGIFNKGEGARKIFEGETRLDGRCPTNTMGGFKWMGHPIGVSGLNQAHELTVQLRGDGGDRQAPKADIGVFANEGGNGATFVTGILRR